MKKKIKWVPTLLVLCVCVNWTGNTSLAKQTNCDRLQNMASGYAQRGAYVRAFQAIKPHIATCHRPSLWAEAAMYAFRLGKRDLAMRWLTQAIKKETRRFEKRYLSRRLARYKKHSIQLDRKQLRKQRVSSNQMNVPGARSSRGEFKLEGPAKQLRESIERSPCQRNKKLRKGAIVFKRVSMPLNKRILFAYRSSRIMPSMKTMLQLLHSTLQPFISKGACILIVGHTDERGKERANLTLSKRRAAAVRRYLLQMGKIPRSSLQEAGMGELQPLVKGASEEAHRQNRRVEFTVMYR
jgi:outer membrane protein OmpA-like peptidoglycan-associated protein